MDWHASVYGGRGGSGYDTPRDFGGESGSSYGARDEVVPESKLKRRGGAAYYRAFDVLSSNRMRDFTCTYTDDGETLHATVHSTENFLSDYDVSTHIDENRSDFTDSSCTCPAFSRFGGICKHVLALIIAYNEDSDSFTVTGGGSQRSARQRRTTSPMLERFMFDEERRQADNAKNRQLDLLKQVSAAEKNGGVLPAVQTSRHLPIGSVHLELVFSKSLRISGGTIRLKLTVPSLRLGYVVSGIPELLSAVREQEYVQYGQKLAFVHTRDTFDEQSRKMLDILDRAVQVRESLNASMYYPATRVASGGGYPVADDELAELLGLFVDTGESVGFVRSGSAFANARDMRVVDADPDFGLRITPAADGGYAITHTASVIAVIDGHPSSYVIVGSAIGADREWFSANTDGLPMIFRCSSQLARRKQLAIALCGEDREIEQYVSPRDLNVFSRTVLPQLTVGAIDGVPAGQESDDGPVAEPSDTADSVATSADDSNSETAFETPQPGNPNELGASGVSGSPANDSDRNQDQDQDQRQPLRGLIADIPAKLLATIQQPCKIELYFDRDRDGITCDAQARYGDRRFHIFNGNGAHDGVVRDTATERLVVEALLHYFPRPDGPVARLAEDDDEGIYRLLTEGLPVLRGLGTVYSTPAFDGVTSMPSPVIKIGLSMRSDLVEISPIADEVDPSEVPQLLNSYHQRKRFHRLRDGRFVNLASMDTSELNTVADDLGIDRDEFADGAVDVPAFQAFYLDGQADDDDKDERFSQYVDNLKIIDPNRYEVPDSLKSVLRPYQVEGFRWLNAVCDKGFGGILADEMGLGKTVQMLAMLLSRLDESREHGPNLIVCPASLVYNWVAEAEKFTPELHVVALAGSKDERQAILASARNYDLLVTSYDLLRRDIDDYRNITFTCMALDEAQYVKNHATKSSQAVRAIQAKHRFALTGTPIENRLSELWSIFDFLMPGMLGSYKHFRGRFEMPILSGDAIVQRRLQVFVGPFILRRLKKDVLGDLPDKIENVITVQLEGEQRKLYAALEQRLRASINRDADFDSGAGKIKVLAQLTRLRQICCDPRLVYENAGKKSAKLDAIEELVESCRDAGRKMLIFSQFTSYLHLIGKRLHKNDIDYDVITGATPKKKRLELVNQFNKDDTPVFLISLKAGNTGLNLTGACVVVHADPWWNAAAQNQATDRAHRIGQTQDVNVYQIVAKDTIEERILNLQHTKSDLAAKFVDDASTTGGSAISRLTKDDLLALLG
ncbi:SNF2-related protein [Bifidobacterium apri]|uniref:DEAD/DEAH box helicase n=1 Tax=Bifidobacterium apri TaxID=1769423 RepID=UPI0039956BB5